MFCFIVSILQYWSQNKAKLHIHTHGDIKINVYEESLVLTLFSPTMWHGERCCENESGAVSKLSIQTK